MAKNIALQTLIEVYWTKKDKMKTEEQSKSQSSSQKDSLSGLVKTQDETFYSKKLDEVSRRLSVLESQNQDLMNRVIDIRRKVKVEEDTIKILEEQADATQKKITQLESELDLAKEFKQRSERKVRTA